MLTSRSSPIEKSTHKDFVSSCKLLIQWISLLGYIIQSDFFFFFFFWETFFINFSLRLCLFWVKIISGNAFPEMRLFGWSGKFYFPEIEIRWPKKKAFDHRNAFTLLFYLQRISEKWERERERERESARARARRRSSSGSRAPAPVRDRDRRRDRDLVKKARSRSGAIAISDRYVPWSRSRIAIAPWAPWSRSRIAITARSSDWKHFWN